MRTDVKVQVQHLFTITDDDGTQFTDALYFPVDAVPDDATLEAMRQQRFANWKAMVSAPSAALTPEQQAQQVVDLVAQGEAIQAQIAAADPVLVQAAEVQLGIAVAPVGVTPVKVALG